MTQRPGERPEQRGQVEPRARTDEVISARGGGRKSEAGHRKGGPASCSAFWAQVICLPLQVDLGDVN